MKQLFLISFLIFTFCFSLKAEEENNPKIEALKIGFITKRLQLTSSEAQKFWPIYNQYEAEKKLVRQNTIGKIKDLKGDGDFNNSDAEQAIINYVEFKAKDLELTKKYISEFRKILPATKIAKLVTAEEQFKKLLIKQAQQGGNGNGQKPWKNK